MCNVDGILSEEPWTENRLKSELAQCAGPCADSALTWLIVGACAYPYLLKHGVQKYLSFESRFLIASASTVFTSFYMGYRSKKKCEKNIRRLYEKQKEKQLKNVKQELSKQEAFIKEES